MGPFTNPRPLAWAGRTAAPLGQPKRSERKLQTWTCLGRSRFHHPTLHDLAIEQVMHGGGQETLAVGLGLLQLGTLLMPAQPMILIHPGYQPKRLESGAPTAAQRSLTMRTSIEG
jgi:hypothetical protein